MPVQPLPSPGKGGDVPKFGPVEPPFGAPVFPASPPPPQTGYFRGDMRPAMGEFQARPQPYTNPYATMMPQRPSTGFGKGGLGSLLGSFMSSYPGGYGSRFGGGYGGSSPFGSYSRGPTYAPQMSPMYQGPMNNLQMVQPSFSQATPDPSSGVTLSGSSQDLMPQGTSGPAVNPSMYTRVPMAPPRGQMMPFFGGLGRFF